MKLFFKAWLLTFCIAWVAFMVLRYNSDLSFFRFVIVEAMGALGFVINPIIILFIVTATFTYKKLKESRNAAQRTAQ